MNGMNAINQSTSNYKRRKVLKPIFRNRYLYLMLVPGVLFFIIFSYVPMGGLIIAFKNYNIFKGMLASEWTGFDNFREIFGMPDFWKVLRNTLIISTYKIVFSFPFPIILALLLNEMRRERFKKLTQTILYLPHFISWVVIWGVMQSILSPSFGITHDIFKLLGMESVYIMADPKYFRGLLVISDMWKGVGWGTIIYLASLSTVDQNICEAAIVDGAGRWKRMRYIMLPSISNVIILLLILRIGSIMEAGFDQVYVLRNDMVKEVGEIFDTYVYTFIAYNQYSLGTAVGMFKSVVAAFLIVTADRVSKLFGTEGLF